MVGVVKFWGQKFPTKATSPPAPLHKWRGEICCVMSAKLKARDSIIPYFITITVVGWVEGLSRPFYKDILLDSLKHCQTEKGLLIHAWVIMNNHAHLVISEGGDNDLPGIVRDCKKYTSRTIVNAIANNKQESRKEWMLNMFSFAGTRNKANDKYQFWQEGYHPIALDTEDKLKQRLNYLHENRYGQVWFGKPHSTGIAVQLIIMRERKDC